MFYTKQEQQQQEQTKRRISKELQPWPSSSTSFQKPSDLYTMVVTNSLYPPLMQQKSWNIAVPFREQRFSHTPSESIANNYTPTANKLKIKNLPPTTNRSIYLKQNNESNEKKKL